MGENLTFGHASVHQKSDWDNSGPVFKMKVKTKCLQAFGLQKDDLLWLQAFTRPENGQLLVLKFNNSFFLRKLTISEGYYRLVSLDNSTSALLWPAHQPLPVVGQVIKLERNW